MSSRTGGGMVSAFTSRAGNCALLQNISCSGHTQVNGSQLEAVPLSHWKTPPALSIIDTRRHNKSTMKGRYFMTNGDGLRRITRKRKRENEEARKDFEHYYKRGWKATLLAKEERQHLPLRLLMRRGRGNKKLKRCYLVKDQV